MNVQVAGSWRLVAAAAMIASVLATAGRTQAAMVGLLVAPFDGPQPIAAKTATVLHLQIWQTLRAAPPNNVHKLSFGRGIVQWAEWTPPTRHSDAVEQLKGTASQMVLWGHVQQVGKGVLVQAYLSMTNPGGAMSGDLWRLALPELGTANAGIAVGLPATMFEFAPIVLELDRIPLLNSHVGTSPANVPVYKDQALTQQIGTLGGDFRALEHGPNVIRIMTSSSDRAASRTGWISVPGLSATRSEVTDFAGGLIRIYRQDWGGAIELLQRVVDTPSTPVSIRVSSYLLMSAASYRLHQQIKAPDRSLEYIQAAERLNPYLRETVKYKCMALLARRDQAAMKQLDDTVRASAFLFPKDDPWLGKVKTVVGRR
jgi:hypothetical protein